MWRRLRGASHVAAWVTLRETGGRRALELWAESSGGSPVRVGGGSLPPRRAARWSVEWRAAPLTREESAMGPRASRGTGDSSPSAAISANQPR